MRRADVAVCWVVVVAVAAVGVEGIMFHLQPNTQKCFKEEIHKNVLVSGEYEVQEAPGQKVDIQVCCQHGQLQVTTPSRVCPYAPMNAGDAMA